MRKNTTPIPYQNQGCGVVVATGLEEKKGLFP